MKSVLAFALTLVACLQVAQAAPAIEARAPTVAKYLCNLPPGDPARSCKQCATAWFKEPSAKTCFSYAITSCNDGKLVAVNGKSCVTSCPEGSYAGQFACLRSPKCDPKTQYLSANEDACITCPNRDPRQVGCDATGILSCSGTGFTLSPDRQSCQCSGPTKVITNPTTCQACSVAFPNSLECDENGPTLCKANFEPYYLEEGSNPTSCVCPSLGYTLTTDGRCIDCTTFDPLAITCNSSGAINLCAGGFYPETKADGTSFCACQGDDNGPQLRIDEGFSCQPCPENGICDNSNVLLCIPGFISLGQVCVMA